MILERLCLLLMPLLVLAKDDYYFKVCNKLILKQPAYTRFSAMSSADMYEELGKNPEYQDSLADCITTCAGLAEPRESDQNHICKVSWGYYKYICSYYHKHASMKWEPVAARIAADPVVAASDNTTLRVKIPSSKLTQNNIIPAGQAFYRARRYPVTMGWGLICYVGGIFAIQAIFNLLSLVAPRAVAYFMQLQVIADLRRYFTLAPLFGAKASRVTGNYNQRLHYLWIAGFVLLNILFACLGYDGQVTSPYYYSDTVHMYSSAIGFRTGYLAMYMLPIAFLFATRNNILIYVTGWSLDVFNLWHRWIGRLCFLQAVAHTAAYYVHYHAMGTVHSEWKQPFWIWGFVATLFFGLMCVQGAKTIRSLAYDLFVILHVILAVFCMVGLYVHLWYTNQCKQVWFVCVALWAADHFLRLARIVLNGGILTAEISGPTAESVILHVPASSVLKYPPGSFVFLHLMHPLLFWQSHPFTIIPENGTKKLVLKHRSGLTKWLYRQVPKGSIKVMVDGPYANPISFKQYDTVSFVAGGVGVTAAYSHLMSLSKEEISAKSISFDWIVPSASSTRYFSEEIEKIKSLDIDFKIHVKRVEDSYSLAATEGQSDGSSDGSSEAKQSSIISASTCCSRSLLQRVMLPKMCLCTKSMAYFVCGPRTLNREAREVIADQVVIGTKYIQLYEESFSM